MACSLLPFVVLVVSRCPVLFCIVFASLVVCVLFLFLVFFFFFQAEDGIRDTSVTGVQTCALPIFTVPVGKPAPGATAVSLAVKIRVCAAAIEVGPVRVVLDDAFWMIWLRAAAVLPDRKSVV